jgi:hypothetical protein
MDGAAEALFVAGTIPLILAGGLHAALAIYDATRPTFFTPLDDSARVSAEATGIELVRMFGSRSGRPSMWRVWIGIHVSHGLGVMTFGLLCLLIVLDDPSLVGEISGLRVITIAFPAAYLVLSRRFWFKGPAGITAASTACFLLSAVLSA